MLSSWVYVSRSVTTRISTVPAILLLSLNDLVNPILISLSIDASQLPRSSSSQNNVGS